MGKKPSCCDHCNYQIDGGCVHHWFAALQAAEKRVEELERINDYRMDVTTTQSETIKRLSETTDSIERAALLRAAEIAEGVTCADGLSVRQSVAVKLRAEAERVGGGDE